MGYGRLIVASLATVVVATGLAGGAGRAEEQVDYLRQIKPVFKARCVACHGVLKHEAGLRLDTAALALKGTAGGAVIKPGSPDASELIRRVTAAPNEGRMPPEGDPLKPEEIGVLRAWIRQGPKPLAQERSEQDPRDHWAFRPVRRPPVPKVHLAGWDRNPIDAFLARDYEKYGLKPQPEAPRLELIRRLYVDLIGLPPSPEELDRVESDRKPGWYERLVDRLLADPRYGERWARHWMDIWRYSDWWGLGDQLRNSQNHIWHWRDWIVDSLNADTPYDEMVREMLAADELYPNDLNKLRATGYLARNYFLFNRNQWMEETVEHVSKGFLGLTVNCAKCHDHKYDPIRQADFYRMRAFFEPYEVRMDVVPGETDLSKDGIPRAFDGQLDTPTYLFVRGQESRPDKANPLSPGVPEILAFEPLKIQPVSLPKEAWQPERRPWVLDAYRDGARKKLSAADDAVAKAHSTGGEPALRLAELGRASARAELDRVERTIDAMRASWSREDAHRFDAALQQAEAEAQLGAIRAARAATAAQAQLTEAEAEEHLRSAAPAQKAAREKELEQARTALQRANRRATSPVGPEERCTPLVGAQWSVTRFQFSGKDDPPVSFGSKSTGRRTALAQWITDRRNPLTARVAANHLWNRHMGVPLVATVFDFGRKGSPPTNPELLDWLAAEFMAPAGGNGSTSAAQVNVSMSKRVHGKPGPLTSGNAGPLTSGKAGTLTSGEARPWSIKHLHRLIVTSAAYKMSSTTRGGEVSQRKDPDNVRFWHREPIRVEAEVVRDSILSLSGSLDPTRGGPPVTAAAQESSRRRCLYFFHSDTDRNRFLTTFDGAAPRECYRRDQSIVPQQALALTNSTLVLDASAPIAERLSKSGTGAPLDDTAFVRRAFRVVLGIEPGPEEIAASRKALDAWRAAGTAGKERARFIWALLNHNDFVTVR